MSCVARCGAMAGAAGFEPTHGRIKTCCLTAWRRPIRFTSRTTSTSLPVLLACDATSKRCDPGLRSTAKWLEVGGRLYQHRPGLGSSQTHKLQRSEEHTSELQSQ